MTNFFSIYTSNGNLIQVYELPEGQVPGPSDIPVGGGYLVGAYDPDLWYVTGVGTSPTAAARPAFTVLSNYRIQANGIDAVNISIPSGTVVTDVETGVQYTAATAETLTIKSTNRSGVFEFIIEPPFPYMSTSILVTAHAD